MEVIIDNLVFAWQKSGGISVVWYELIKRMLKCSSLTDKISFINTIGTNDNIREFNKQVQNYEMFL